MKSKEGNKNKGGRPPLEKQLLRKRELVFLNEIEKKRLLVEKEQLGLEDFSEFIRWKLLNDNQNKPLINQVELLKRLDNLGLAIGKIGNNINQLAKVGNTMILKGRFDPSFIDGTNELLTEYISIQEDLKRSLRKLVFT